MSSCSNSSSNSGSTQATSEFQLVRISVRDEEPWEINREIEFEFSKPVSFSSVDSSKFNIQVEATGEPATGSFFFKRVDTDGDGVVDTDDRNTIVFQPTCPTLADFSDAGLTPGGVRYRLTVVGRSSGTNDTVLSTSNERLEVSQTRHFVTRNSPDRNVIFLDTASGPPVPVVRDKNSIKKPVDGVSYIEIGGNPDVASRIFYEFDPATQTYSTAPGSKAPSSAPLNLYSQSGSKTSVIIEFNQAVDPDPVNMSDARIRLEILTSTSPDVWVPIDTAVELVANCTRVGATVRLTPVGLLPAGSQFRVVVLPGFRDIVREPTQVAAADFAISPTQNLTFASLEPATEGADEFFESFDFGGSSRSSFQDDGALFDTPGALWNGGRLEAAFDFDGDGGPGGTFDWRIKSGEIFLFDTNFQEVSPVPGTATQPGLFSDGIVNVRNLTIEAGGELKVQGPNPIQINATGTVRIEGKLDISGFDAKDVATLNTGHQPETGGAGGPGAGAGGRASEVTNSSTPRGGTGFGPVTNGVQEPGAGGQGGESSYAPANLGKDARRPAGGGGGRFAPDFDVTKAGFFAEQGFNGNPEGTGAETDKSPAIGGVPGTGPFLDNDTTNDFFGTKPIVTTTAPYTLVGLIRGELTRPRSGYGGGGGGDALPSKKFPTPRWTPGSDEKGGGGGGGGGSIRIRALGPIVFGNNGRLIAEGGRGGAGENTLFLDHVGGTGGSGSGGHVILESAVRVDFTNGDPATAQSVNAYISTKGKPGEKGTRTNGNGETIPTNMSYGGGGGPGVVQLHVPSLTPPSDQIVMGSFVSDIVVPSSSIGANPFDSLELVAKPLAHQMIPTFGARSKARSKWISIGGADVNVAAGTPDLVEFMFGGIDTTNADPNELGKILSSGGLVQDLPPLLGPTSFGLADLEDNGATILIAGSDLDPLRGVGGSGDPDDIYLRAPTLLKNFTLRCDDAGASTIDFVVVGATYLDNASTPELRLTIDTKSETLADFVGRTTSPRYSLIPRFFRVFQKQTDGSLLQGALPDDVFVRFTFEAAADDGLGNPVPLAKFGPANNSLTTNDIGEFATKLSPGELQFFRFEIEFNLDADGSGVDPCLDGATSCTLPIILDFVRFPFRF